MNYHIPRKGYGFRDLLRRGLGRRFFALALAALICLGLFPVPAAYADPTVTAPVSAAPAGITVDRMSETPASSGKAMTNTYILEVSTGSVKQGRKIDNIDYFTIYYRYKRYDSSNRFIGYGTSVEVVFPDLDGVRYGMDTAAAAGNRNSRISNVENNFGYTIDSLGNRETLRAVSADQFLFQTKYPMDVVDKIQIFGKKTGQASDWACQFMHIMRVDKLYGEEMYGWYSQDGYIDFKGEMIADVVMQGGSGNFKFSGTGYVYNITPPGEGGASGVSLANVDNKNDARLKNNRVGEQHDTQVNNRLTIRMDLADTGKAGFECLGGSYAAGYESKVSQLHLCETAAMTIRYKDIYGAVRETRVPLIISSLGWTMEKTNTDLAICGFAQQGDSIPVSLMLPDFAEYVSSYLSLGEARAREKTGMKTSDNADKTIRPTRVSQADTESISYICYAVYREVSVFIPTESAILTYGYTAGANEPGKFYTSGGSMGVFVDPGSDLSFSLMNYYDGMKLRPVDNNERYLVTISTDNVANAGTTDDIYIQFKYINKSDKEIKSAEFRVRDYVQQFYGEWPGNVPDFAYRYGFRESGTVQFMVPLRNVKQFESVSFKLKGKDEWQFKGVTIQMISSLPPPTRTAKWTKIDKQDLKTYVDITRPIDAQDPMFSMGTVYKDEDSIIPSDDDAWKPGDLIQDDGTYHEFNGNSEEVVREEIDWTTLQYYMTYEDTLQDLGFTRERCTYDITVFVAKNKVNDIEDDCGSENLFYFQLIFENGKSGCVLANQQLSADAFRTGAESTFSITTNRNFGELESILIIPDDQDSNGNIYDKLKIEKISVSRKSTGGISPTWIADSDDEDGLGWVGIDYQDPGAAASNQGVEGRSITEIAHIYQITKTSYKTKLMISISTASYTTEDLLDGSGNLIPIPDPTLRGGMTALINYFDHEGNYRTVEHTDIVKLMNEYAATENKYVRSVDGKTETVPYVVSDTKYQFRGGTTDNFFIEVDNISSIADMELQIRSDVGTNWNIENVSVYLVQGPGARYINGNGEYDYKYPANKGVLYRCCWNRPQGLRQHVDIYRSEDDTTIAKVNITFNDNSFPVNSEESTITVIKKEPASKDDTLNLFIYPSTENAATDPSLYSLKSEVLYTDTLTHSPLRIGSDKMSLTTDSTGRPVFYAVGLSANYFESISGVEVRTDSVRPVHAPISYAIVQRVRSGVLIDSYYLTGIGNADQGLTLTAAQNPAGQSVQRLMLQVDQNTMYQDLVKDEKDLAVALTFTTDYAGSGELRTKYIYLTDTGIKSVEAGQVLEIDFNIANIREVKAVNLATIGRLDVGFESGVALHQTGAGAVTDKWSFRSRLTPSRNPVRVDANGVASLLDMDIATAADDGTVTSGTNGPIRMTVGFLNGNGNLMTKTFDDIRDYLDNDSAFASGRTDHVRMVIQDMAALRWIEFEPRAKAGEQQTTATWKVASLSTMKDLSGFTISRMLNKLVKENEPLRVGLADILVSGLVSIITKPTETGKASGDYAIPAEGRLDIVLNPGEGVRVLPQIEGSLENVEVTLNRYDPATGGLGRADLVDTRGFTAELLRAKAAEAEAKGFTEEAAVWRSLEVDEGYWAVETLINRVQNRYDVNYAAFIPPHNYTGSPMYYRITITSLENEEATAVINLTVPTEVNEAEQRISEAHERDMQVHEHTIVAVPAIAPTCISEGNSTYFACAGCGKYFADALGDREISLESTVLPYGDHVYGSYVSSEGGHYRTCTVCGESESVSAHTYVDKVVQPTSTEKGYTLHTCSVCGYSYKDNYFCSHVYGSYTISESGHYRTCTICGESERLTAHTFVDTIDVPATPTEPGSKTRTCSVCGYSVSQEIPPLGYDYVVHFSLPDGVEPVRDMTCNSLKGITLPWVNAPSGYFFLGWTTEPHNHEANAPANIYPYSEKYFAEQETTLYGLFTNGLSADLVTSYPDDLTGRYLIVYGELSPGFNVLFRPMPGAPDGRKFARHEGEDDWEALNMELNGTHLTGVLPEYVYDISLIEGTTDQYTLWNETTGTYLSKNQGLSGSSTYSLETCAWYFMVGGYDNALFYYKNPMRFLAFDDSTWKVMSYDPPEVFLWKVSGTIHYTTVID